MSDLTEMRDWCRRMADLTQPITETEVVDGEPVTTVTHGVPSDADRALWRQLALEIDAHLAARTGRPQIWNHGHHDDDAQLTIGDA